MIVCGMSVGYPDESEPVNGFIPKRISIDEYVKWFD